MDGQVELHLVDALVTLRELLSDPLIALAGALLGHLSGRYAERASARRQDWAAIVNELFPLLHRQRNAVTPWGRIDADQRRRLLSAATLLHRLRLRRALDAYDAQQDRCHQAITGQMMLDDPAAHTAAVDRILSLLR